YQQEPDSVVWAIKKPGQLIGLTYNEEQSVIAWHRHPMTDKNNDVSVEAIACIPAADGSQNELWMIVARTINGTLRRYVEYLAPHFLTGDELATDSLYSDCGTTYSGAPTTTITGLGYLEGETVKVLVDGARHADCVVTGGQITLNWAGSVV